MQFSTILAAAGIIAATSAAPVAEVKSMMAAGQWTLLNFTRTCNSADTTCRYTYTVKADNTPNAAANYTVNGSPASRAPYNSLAVGPYTIGSSWSGQFGPNNGFQTLSVVKNRQIVYPAYTDAQLANGRTVAPDQSYTPQALP